MSDRRNRELVSKPVAKLLAQLRLYGCAELRATTWRVAASGVSFQHATIEAAYERYLVKIIHDSKYKRKQIVELTEIGELAATGVVDRMTNVPVRRGVSEESALLIQEIIAA